MFIHFSARVWNFLKGQEGPTAVEYAVMVALVILACVIGIAVLGVDLAAIFTGASTSTGQ